MQECEYEISQKGELVAKLENKTKEISQMLNNLNKINKTDGKLENEDKTETEKIKKENVEKSESEKEEEKLIVTQTDALPKDINSESAE